MEILDAIESDDARNRFNRAISSFSENDVETQLLVIETVLGKLQDYTSSRSEIESYVIDLLKHTSVKKLPWKILDTCCIYEASNVLDVALNFNLKEIPFDLIWQSAIENCEKCIFVLLKRDIPFTSYDSLFEHGSDQAITAVLEKYPDIIVEVLLDDEVPDFRDYVLIDYIRENSNLTTEQKSKQSKYISSKLKYKAELVKMLFITNSTDNKLIEFIENFRHEFSDEFLNEMYKLAVKHSRKNVIDFFLNFSYEINLPLRTTGLNLQTNKIYETGYYIPEFSFQERYVLTLPREDKELLYLYTTGVLDAENKQLFKHPELPCIDEKCEMIREIQRIISNAPEIHKEFTVYRGGSEGYHSFPGRAIISTTTDVKVMKSFAENRFGYELTVKKGCRALPLYVLSSHQNEMEFLFDGEMVEFEYENARIEGKLTIFEMDIVPKA
jgi:hypothetical protein